jgi:tRNA threonylcarbamoyladenosine modification (KEOPS) complex  Pcc1 subunit
MKSRIDEIADLRHDASPCDAKAGAFDTSSMDAAWESALRLINAAAFIDRTMPSTTFA